MIGWTFQVKLNGSFGRGRASVPPSMTGVWGQPAGSCQEQCGVSCRLHPTLDREGKHTKPRSEVDGLPTQDKVLLFPKLFTLLVFNERYPKRPPDPSPVLDGMLLTRGNRQHHL